jgi:hypothetical protein
MGGEQAHLGTRHGEERSASAAGFRRAREPKSRVEWRARRTTSLGEQEEVEVEWKGRRRRRGSRAVIN